MSAPHVPADPASLAATAAVARRGALALEDGAAELATTLRLLGDQWVGPEARRSRRRLDQIAQTGAALGAELRVLAGALHDLATTAAAGRAAEDAAPARTLARSTATLTELCERSEAMLARWHAGVDRL